MEGESRIEKEMEARKGLSLMLLALKMEETGLEPRNVGGL